jgi:ABC-type sugar transport system substrate-binding protein
MNRLRLGIFSCATLAMGIGLASCGGDSYHQKEERYVFVTFNSTLPYWQEAEAGFQDAGKWLGVKVEFSGPEKFSPEEELAAFQKALS